MKFVYARMSSNLSSIIIIINNIDNIPTETFPFGNI